MKRRAALLGALLGLATSAGWAQVPVAQVAVTGRVAQPATYSVEALAAMPGFEVQGAVHGTQLSTFVGAMLWPLIAASGPLDGPERGSHLQHVIFARGADGYVVALAMGEIDPEFEGKPVIVAYKQDGALLPAPHLVVPGDRRAGRNVPELVAIEVR